MHKTLCTDKRLIAKHTKALNKRKVKNLVIKAHPSKQKHETKNSTYQKS